MRISPVLAGEEGAAWECILGIVQTNGLGWRTSNLTSY